MKQIYRILPVILIMLGIFASLHYLVYMVTTRSVAGSHFSNFFGLLLTFFLISIPLGFIGTRLQSRIMKAFTWIGYTWMGVFTILFFLCLLEMLISFALPHDHSYWVLPVTLLISIYSLMNGLAFPEVNTHHIPHEKLRGLSLVQISDVHVGMLHLNQKWFERVIAKVRELKPHVFVITGDLIEGYPDEIAPQLEILKGLNEIKHKFFITGNHEYIHGGEIWEKRLAEMGFQVLHNSNELVEFNGGKLLVAGVPDRMIRRFTGESFSRPDEALKSPHEVDFKILLAHQPASVNDLRNETCDLILTGHTHGGQIFPFHVFVRGAQPVVKGFKTVKKIKVFAHQGTGLWGPPMRWFSRNEIVVFNWK